MNQMRLLYLFLLSGIFRVEAQTSFSQDDLPTQEGVNNFQPSLAVVIGILCIMFSLTFILLVYAKFCHRGTSPIFGVETNNPALVRSASRLSGLDKTVIESLPFFRFSSLRGSKQGLECAVCLSKFEDIEILRLLPKCKHAFHIGCIDQWLEKHSTCPLCRHKVSAEDKTVFAYSNSMRFSLSQSELREDSNIGIYVQREEENRGSSRFVSMEKRKDDQKEEEEALTREEDNKEKILHKLNHKIIVSDFVFKNRWSSVSSSDLMLLSSEMISTISSNRFSSLDGNNEVLMSKKGAENEEIVKIKEEMERKRLIETRVSFIPCVASTSESIESTDPGCKSRTMNSPGNRRSFSEITALSRFDDFGYKRRFRESLDVEDNAKEAKMRRLWLRIARTRAQWFRERSQMSQNTTQNQLDV